AGFDLGAWLQGKVVDRFARDEGVAFVSGDGNMRPTGFLSGQFSAASDASRPWWTVQYIPTGQSGAFASSNPADVLQTTVYALRAPYRAGPGVAWLMNSNTMAAVAKLKDGQGNYLLQRAIALGAPNTLLGYPIEIDDIGMPDIGANSPSIAFGNWR